MIFPFRPKKKTGDYIRSFVNLSLKAFLSAATLKSAIRHVRAVTAVCSDNTTATVYDMITARFCCRLIAFFLFIFFVHVFTSSLFRIFFLLGSIVMQTTLRSLIKHRIHQSRLRYLRKPTCWFRSNIPDFNILIIQPIICWINVFIHDRQTHRAVLS